MGSHSPHDYVVGFLVPINMVSTNVPNKIGMSGLSWSHCFNCSAPYSCTNTSFGTWQIGSGDQMFQYRDVHLADVVSNNNTSCKVLLGLPDSYASPAGKASLQSLNCNFSASVLQMALELSGTAIGLVVAPELPQLGLVALFGNWSQDYTLTISVINIGHSRGNFSAIVKQCCLHMADLTIQCYTKANGDLSFTNNHLWLVATVSETITFTTTILPNEDLIPKASVSKSLSCDMEVVEANNLTRLSYFYSMSNSYAVPPTNSNHTVDPETPINPRAISFDTYLEGGFLAINHNVLIAR